MKLLFIGNSHTYYNAMPETVLYLLEATGQKTHVSVLTEGGRSLAQHAMSPATALNIRCGKYDLVIAQDKSSGFDPITFKDGAKAIKEMADHANTPLVLYMPWTGRAKRIHQPTMTEAYQQFCKANGCLLAPVGEVFSRLLTSNGPDLLYHEDGNHASPLGSYLAAVTIFYTITGRKRIINVEDMKDPGIAAGFPSELCQRIHTEACRMSRLYNG